ncbi:MAG: hypothetical protein P4L53_08955 [Candidatus Obscuribacterales bacterium]|nr:hypothetical protein [Candidatus Obscuribacterales bacterium]
MYINIFAQLIFGLCLGYSIATFSESFFHHHIGHASPRLRRFWARHPFIGKPFLNAYYEHHTIHHARTFRKDFVTQFTSPEEEEKLYQSMPKDRRDFIRKEEYGVTLKGFGIVMFVLPIVPSVPFIYLLFGLWVLLGALFPMFVLYPLMSKWIHRMLHKADENLLHECWRIEIWVMNTLYMRTVLVDHYLHHEYVLCNFNLLRGGDYLRGYHRNANEKELLALRLIGAARAHGRQGSPVGKPTRKIRT